MFKIFETYLHLKYSLYFPILTPTEKILSTHFSEVCTHCIIIFARIWMMLFTIFLFKTESIFQNTFYKLVFMHNSEMRAIYMGNGHMIWKNTDNIRILYALEIKRSFSQLASSEDLNFKSLYTETGWP